MILVPRSVQSCSISERVSSWRFSGTGSLQGRVEAEVHHVAAETEPDSEGLTTDEVQPASETSIFIWRKFDKITFCVFNLYHCISDLEIG